MLLAFRSVFLVQSLVLLFQLIVLFLFDCNFFLGFLCLFSGPLKLRLKSSYLFVLFHDFLWEWLDFVFKVEDFQIFYENHVKELLSHLSGVGIFFLQLTFIIYQFLCIIVHNFLILFDLIIICFFFLVLQNFMSVVKIFLFEILYFQI